MLSYPQCPRSHYQASKFCVDKSCNYNPFICRHCSDQGCESLHNHLGRLTTKRCQSLYPLLQSIITMSDFSLGDLQAITKQADILIGQIREIVEYYTKSLQRLRDSVALRPEVRKVVELVRVRKTEALTGADMSRCIEVLEMGSYYVNREQVERDVKLKEGQFGQMLADISRRIEEYIAEEKEKVKPVYAKAEQFRKQGKFKQALDLYSEALSVERSGNIYNSRGSAYFSVDDFQSALADFDKAIELDGSKAIYHFNKANTYYNIKNYQDCLPQYTKAIQLDARKPDYFDHRGNAYYNLQDYKNAVKDYTKAIELDPKNPSYVSNRANSYYSLKDYNKALVDYSKAIAIGQNNPNPWNHFHRGMVFSDIGRFAEAAADFSRAIELQPQTGAFYSRRALALLQLRNFEKSLSDLDKAIDLDVFAADNYNTKGNVLFSLKRYSEALENYTKAITLDRQNAQYFNNRGNIYNILEDYGNALEDLNQAILLVNNREIFYENRAITLDKLKKNNEAAMDRQAAKELRKRKQLQKVSSSSSTSTSSI